MNKTAVARELLQVAKLLSGARLRLSPRVLAEAMDFALDEQVKTTDISATVRVKWSGGYERETRDSPAEYPEIDDMEFVEWDKMVLKPNRIALDKFCDDFVRVLGGEKTSALALPPKLVKKIVADAFSQGHAWRVEVSVGVIGADGRVWDLEDGRVVKVFGRVSGNSIALTVKPTPDAEQVIMDHVDAHSDGLEPEDTREPDDYEPDYY